MKFVKFGAVLGAVTIALAANDALAEQCSGYVVSKPLPPIALRDAPDGSKVKWFSSEGIFIVDSPKDHPANRVNRVCGGGFKIAADGKSGLGVGSCTYTDFAGDVFHLSWQSTFIEGTWKIIGAQENSRTSLAKAHSSQPRGSRISGAARLGKAIAACHNPCLLLP